MITSVDSCVVESWPGQLLHIHKQVTLEDEFAFLVFLTLLIGLIL